MTSPQELDLNSSFVSKAARIAKRKLEEKQKLDKDKKKSPEKEKSKSVSDKEEVAVKEAQKQVRDYTRVGKKKDCSCNFVRLVIVIFRLCEQDSAPARLTSEENIKISTDLASTSSHFIAIDLSVSVNLKVVFFFLFLVMGNKFASAGDYNMAVKYFTDAIKYNPKEFK